MSSLEPDSGPVSVSASEDDVVAVDATAEVTVEADNNANGGDEGAPQSTTATTDTDTVTADSAVEVNEPEEDAGKESGSASGGEPEPAEPVEPPKQRTNKVPTSVASGQAGELDIGAFVNEPARANAGQGMGEGGSDDGVDRDYEFGRENGVDSYVEGGGVGGGGESGEYREEDEDFDTDDGYYHTALDHSELINKPFLGGFRHRVTGIEYHHAATQCDLLGRKKEVKEHVEKFHRDTQTVKMATRSINTQREAATQMKKPGLSIEDRTDRVLIAQHYLTADEVWENRLQKIIVIQSYVRGWRSRVRARKLREALELKKQAVAAAEAERAAMAEENRMREIERRMNPKSAADFEVLHNELEAWRTAEVKRIENSGLTPEERHAQMADLLSKETKLLQTIDKLKISASRENKDKNATSVLELMAAPKKWALSDGRVMEVHTPYTIRARELADLYNGLRLPLLTIDERLDVLLHVKWMVKEFDCALTREIVELIDREADMLERGRPDKALEGLRARLLTLVLQFIKTPEFNPEAARFQKIPHNLVDRSNTKPINAPASRRPAPRGERPTSVLSTSSRINTGTF